MKYINVNSKTSETCSIIGWKVSEQTQEVNWPFAAESRAAGWANFKDVKKIM